MLPDHIGQLKPHQLTRHSLSDEVLAFTEQQKRAFKMTARFGVLSGKLVGYPANAMRNAGLW